MECPSCSFTTSVQAMRCPQCASVFDLEAMEEYEHLAYLLSKLRNWRDTRAIAPDLATALIERVSGERELLQIRLGLRTEPAPQPTSRSTAEPAAPEPSLAVEDPAVAASSAAQSQHAPPPVRPREPALDLGKAWTNLTDSIPPIRFSWAGLWSALLSERALNSMIYLAAFLIVAALASFTILRWNTLAAWQQLSIIGASTAAFYGLGYWVKVRLGLARGGTGLLVIASAVVAINVVAVTRAGPFELGVEGTWAATSLVALPFYLATALLLPERPFAVLAVIAGLSAPVALLTAVGIDLEWQSIVLVATMGIYLVAAHRFAKGKYASFYEPLLWSANAIVPATLAATLAWKLAWINGASLVDPLAHSPDSYALGIGWWTGVASYAVASARYFRRAYWSFATVALTLVSYYFTGQLLFDLEPHELALFMLAPALILVAMAEIAARWRAADGETPGALPERRRDMLSMEALRGQRLWALATLPLLVGGYVAAATALVLASYDLATPVGHEAEAIAIFSVLCAGAAASAFLRRSEVFAHVAAWLFPVPFFVAASHGFIFDIEFRPEQHALSLVLFAPFYLAIGIILDRVKGSYSRAPYAAAYGATIVAMVWSSSDTEVAFQVMGVALAVYVVSAIQEYRGQHPVLARSAGQAAAWTPQLLQRARRLFLSPNAEVEPLPERIGEENYGSIFVFLTAILLPIWASLGLDLLETSYSYYGLVYAFLALAYVAFGVLVRSSRPSYAKLTLAFGYVLSIAGPAVAFPRGAMTAELEGVFIGTLGISGMLYAASAVAFRKSWLLYPVAVGLPTILALLLYQPGINLGTDLSGRNVSYDLFVGPAVAALGLLYTMIPPIRTVLRGAQTPEETYRPSEYALPFYHSGHLLVVSGMVMAGLLAIGERHDIGVTSPTAIPLLVAMSIAAVQYAASAWVHRQGLWVYPAAALGPLVLTFVLVELEAASPAYGVSIASLALAYVVAPPVVRLLRNGTAILQQYRPGEFSLPLYAIAYPAGFAGVAAVGTLAAADAESISVETLSSIPLLTALGLLTTQLALSAISLRHEAFVYASAALLPILLVFGLGRLEVDQPYYAVALSALGLSYVLGPPLARALYRIESPWQAYSPTRLTAPIYIVAYPVAIVGAVLAGTLAVSGNEFDSGPLIIALSLVLAQFVVSAVILRDGRWVYGAGTVLPILGGFVLEKLGAPREYFGVGGVALASVYVLAPLVVDYGYRRARNEGGPFEANAYSRPLLELGFGLSIIGVLASVLMDMLAGISALSLAGGIYLISGFALRQRVFLHAMAGVWAAAFVMGLTLTTLDIRYYGLAIMGASTVGLALTPLLRLSWQRATHSRDEGVPWREPLATLHESPAFALYILAYLGALAAIALPWVEVGSLRDNLPLAMTLVWTSAMFAFGIWVFRSSIFLWATLLSLDLALLTGMWSGNPDLSDPAIAISLIPATYGLFLGGGWATWRLRGSIVEEPRSQPDTLERPPSWLAWAAPFLGLALVHVVASLALTTGDSEAGLTLAMAYFALAAAGSLALRLEAAAWAALLLGGIGFAHGMSLVSVEPREGILYAAIMAVGVRAVGYLLQRTLETLDDETALRPLRVWLRPLSLAPYVVTAGTLVAAIAILWDDGDLALPDTQWLLATMFVAGLNLSIAALAERRVWLAYPAAGLIIAAAMLEAVHFELEQPQVYVLPVGVYLLAIGQLERRRLGWQLTMPLVGTALFLILGTTLLQSLSLLGDEGQEFIYGLVLLAESLVLVTWGTLQRVRLTFFTGNVSAIVAILVMIGQPLVPAASALDVEPLAAIFGGIGIVLLGIAVFLERKREAVLQRGREWLGRLDDWD